MGNEGFELEITELRLGLPGRIATTTPNIDPEWESKNEKKRGFSEIGGGGEPTGKVTVAVGWPPVCSSRRSIGGEKDCLEASKRLVKVSMDGVPFLRKIDVSGYQHYSQLVAAIEKLFGCSRIREALKDANNSEYVPIYEDKDGDWLLLGDVPWKMFVESCKRLRIMKRSDVKGLGLQSKKLCHR